MPAPVTDPRNVWSRLLTMLDLAESGQAEAAIAAFEALKYAPGLNEDVLAVYARQVDRARAAAPLCPRIDRPADYLGRDDGILRPPFRRLDPGANPPSPYPWGMALPGFAGLQNDAGFIYDAATTFAPHLPEGRIDRVEVLYEAPDTAAAAALTGDLAAQDFLGRITLTLFGGVTHDGAQGACPEGLLSGPGAAKLAECAARADLLVILSGQVRLDPGAVARAAFPATVSDTVLQTLVPQDGEAEASATPYMMTALRRTHGGRYPYRDMAGLNLVLTPALLARIGPPDARFQGTLMAGRELGWRAVNMGAYLQPLAVPRLDPAAAPRAEDTEADQTLFRQLCPNAWDRKANGRFEIPSVSVYIPAYNAGKYIERAIDSVLGQDFEDLEVCISDDGSRDNTRAILERTYANEPRVRYSANPNGGIGFASNNAITMSRGLYIGQLDSDDCLKPGAVRRLKEHLDAHPDLACAYGSCERVDADGTYLQDEYSWPVFSREKMMITSIAHHFRMFRRAAWERTSGFREDIVNAVDYDIFLKLAEVGRLEHVEEVLYQRRWHGENTSNVNESFQTSNTYRVQTEALARQGLARFWEVHIPRPDQPRRVTFRRKADTRIVLFWPDYSRSNPYQRLLYQTDDPELEIVAGDVDAALRMLETATRPGEVTFHLHWLNFLLRDITDRSEAQAAVEAFHDKLRRFVLAGGRLIWTVHNVVSHDSPFADLEADLSARIAALATAVHVHSAGSVAEIAQSFALPADRIRVSRHGHYIGAYPDFVSRAVARQTLGLTDDDDVILFTGQIRPYKGVEALIKVMRRLLAERPQTVLVLAGAMQFGLMSEVAPALTEAERARIRVTGRFLDDMEMQLFFRAADIAAYPYEKILTSGSLMLALSYGVPVVIPRVAMTREVLDGQEAGVLYDADEGEAGLETALRTLLAAKDTGQLETMAQNARARAEALDWPDAAGVLAAEQPVIGNKE